MTETELLVALSIDSIDDLYEGVAAVEDVEGDALDALLHLSGWEDDVLVVAVADKLGEADDFSDDRIEATLMELSQHAAAEVREAAVHALMWVETEEATARALDMLDTDPDGLVRAGAAEALGFAHVKEALAPLKAAMADPDDRVRAAAAASIGEIGEPDLLPFLAEQLESQSAMETRVEIMGAQWRLGRVEALEDIAGVLRRAPEDLYPRIFKVLEELVERPGNTEALMKDHSAYLAKVMKLVEEASEVHGEYARQLLDRIVAV